MQDNRVAISTWIIIFMAVLIWSGIGPKDRVTWMLEVAPAIIGFISMAITYQRFPLTPLLYILILIHSIILIVGGHYTYAEVPLFDDMKELFGWERNNYDKLGHFVQGFVPAIIARELVIRLNVFNSAKWRTFFIISFCLGFSADMGWCLLGAIIALLTLSKWHHKQLGRLRKDL